MAQTRVLLALTVLAFLLLVVVAALCKETPNSIAPVRSTSKRGWPEMHVIAVSVPSDRAQPLSIQFDLFNKGEAATAVAQSQFGALLSTKEEPWLFSGDLAFAADAPAIFTLKPGDRISITATTQKDRFSGKIWSEVVPKRSTLTIRINSGKTQEFANQWLGSTHSDDYELDTSR